MGDRYEDKGYVSLGYGYMSDSYFPTNVTDYSQTSKDGASISLVWRVSGSKAIC